MMISTVHPNILFVLVSSLAAGAYATGHETSSATKGGRFDSSTWTDAYDRLFHIGNITVAVGKDSTILKIKDKDGRHLLKGNLGVYSANSVNKLVHHSHDNTYLSFQEPLLSDLHIKNYQYHDNDCTDVSWRALSCVTETFTDCFHFGDAHWYGGPELFHQSWPLEEAQHDMAPYTGQDTLGTGNYGPVQERIFFSSKGIGIHIEEDVPLFVSMNATGDDMFCFQSKFDNYFYSNRNNSLPWLNYTICTASDVKSIYQVMADRYIQKPSSMVNPDLIRKPIWSSWAEYKSRINQSEVASFVSNIKKNNLSISQVEIDDDWTVRYGDLDFNKTSFPDPKSLVDSMHSQNISVTLWVHPFINIDAEAFPYLASKGWMIPDVSGARPALTSWWNGQMAGHIDFSNPDAAQWFLDELNRLRTTYGVDSFKFDAGDVNYLPPVFKSHQDFVNPNHLTRLYADVAHQSDTSNRVEIRTGARTQNLPVMVRMLDKLSTWSLDDGLKSIITTGLVFGVIGYPFVLPDLIGGNTYNNPLDPELFIRWIQANALMPLMQFSLAPWKTNNATVLRVAQDMVQLHERYADKLVGLANDSITTGYPIIRPLWWIAPADEAALTVDDQFLIGDDLLVAPVVEKGATSRRIYLPAGRWRDELKGKTVDGGTWIDYPVNLQDLPYFTKVE